jgi:ABC-2 type transport system permease protein
MKKLLRTSAFLTKEISEVVRQPGLILTLIVGPFLILLLFGLGYNVDFAPVKTLYVVQPNSPLAADIVTYAKELGSQLQDAGTTSDEDAARQQLRDRKIDLAILVPADPAQAVTTKRQVPIVFLYNAVDPLAVDHVQFLAQTFAAAVNQQVVVQAIQQGKNNSSATQAALSAAMSDATALRQALQAGNTVAAAAAQQRLGQEIGPLVSQISALGALASALGQSGNETQLRQALDQVRQLGNTISAGSNSGAAGLAQELAAAQQLEQALANLNQQFRQLSDVPAAVLVQPFSAETKAVAATAPTPSEFFVPAVIVLLLQHLAVTFGALSIVRERTLGTMELFRVSPLSAGETLAGKYVSYFVFCAMIAAVLVAVMFFGLSVPMAGAWTRLGYALALVLFASLGWGFTISALSKNEGQAIQYSMIMLLTSFFFSGFVLDLNTLSQPVRVISRLLPATYGIAFLQDVMFRGAGLRLIYLVSALGLGIAMLILAWLLTRRRMLRA